MLYYVFFYVLSALKNCCLSMLKKVVSIGIRMPNNIYCESWLPMRTSKASPSPLCKQASYNYSFTATIKSHNYSKLPADSCYDLPGPCSGARRYGRPIA